MNPNWKCSRCGVRGHISRFPVVCCGVSYQSANWSVPPSLLRRGINFARDSLKHGLSGSQLVDDGTRNWRLSQCTSCVEYFNAELETCTHAKCGCGMKKQRGIIDALGWASKRCPIGRWDNPPPRFVTSADLANDTIKLIPKLPTDLSGIVGIPRSGMVPATLLATYLHLPLFEMTNTGPRQLSNGWRLSDSAHIERHGPMLLVDDTSMHGNAMNMAKAQWKETKRKQEVIGAVVYCSPQKYHHHGPMPDLWAVDLEHPHLLEWCLFNCGFMHFSALDFDGIMTVDQTQHPQYLPRKYPLKLIVTGRLERERQRTLDWMSRHGITAERLEMWPGTLEDREKPGAIAAFKAEHFKKSGLQFFVESDPEQAAEIARLTRKTVVCPSAKRCF